MKFLVEITKRWNGEPTGCSCTVEAQTRANANSLAGRWIKSHAPDPRHIAPAWTMTFLGTEQRVTVVDYGSWTYFGRITLLDDATAGKHTAKRKTKMSKKKPYSRIENGKTLRSIAFELKRNLKELAKAKAPEWYVRLVEECNHEIAKVVKLRDFLWVQDTKDSEARLSDEAQKVCPKVLKLLTKQEKAMTAFCEILTERINLGWPKDPANLPCKETKKDPTKKAPAKKDK